jgi:hypothetical protein
VRAGRAGGRYSRSNGLAVSIAARRCAGLVELPIQHGVAVIGHVAAAAWARVRSWNRYRPGVDAMHVRRRHTRWHYPAVQTPETAAGPHACVVRTPA